MFSNYFFIYFDSWVLIWVILQSEFAHFSLVCIIFLKKMFLFLLLLVSVLVLVFLSIIVWMPYTIYMKPKSFLFFIF